MPHVASRQGDGRVGGDEKHGLHFMR
jgi:hypothetical protein